MGTSNEYKRSGTGVLRFIALLCLCAWTFMPEAVWGEEGQPAPPKLVLYTAMNATTAQMPLWKMIRSGWPQDYSLSVNYWKTLDDLRGMMLAGKGDIWIGHLEGFALAARRGAPVTVLAVTGWKKFYLVGRGMAASKPPTLEDIAAELKRNGMALPVAPRESPAASILEGIALRGGPQFTLAPMPPQQLMLEMLRGKFPYAILPEPMLSALLAKDQTIQVLISLEEEYARRFGGEQRLPWAGIAINKDFAARNPAFVASFIQMLQQAGAELADDPKASVDVLPEQTVSLLGRAVLLDSLRRDKVFVLPAHAVKREIEDFLRVALPELQAPSAMKAIMDAGFLYTEK